MLTAFLRFLPIVCLVLAPLAGCGDGGTATNKLSGKVILPPGVKLAKTDSVMLVFTPLEGEKGGGSGNINAEDLSFGPLMVSPGKFKVIIQITPYQGEPGSEKRVAAFEAFNKAYDMKNTKITCEVGTAKEQSFVIDMAKGTATKQ